MQHGFYYLELCIEGLFPPWVQTSSVRYDLHPRMPMAVALSFPPFLVVALRTCLFSGYA